MKVIEETISELPIKDQRLVKALLRDIEEINQNLPPKTNEIYLEWQDYHDEYSPERTDPCPDYYGMYTVRRIGTLDILGVEMDLQTLDIAICLLNNFLVYD